MAILLEHGENVSVPPEGKSWLKLDDDGAIAVVAPDGSESPAAASGVATLTGDGVDNTDPANPVIDLAGVITSAMFDAGAVAPAATTADTATAIADGAVSTSAKLAADVVTADKILETIDLIVGTISVGNGSAATPSVQVGAEEHGLYRAAADRLAFAVAGAIKAYLDGSISALVMSGAVGGTVNVSSGGEAGWRGNTSNGCTVLPGTHDVTVGPSGALTTNAAAGFLDVPSCAGTPVGTPTPISGKVPLVVDTSNNKLYGYYGAAWHDLTGT